MKLSVTQPSGGLRAGRLVTSILQITAAPPPTTLQTLPAAGPPLEPPQPPVAAAQPPPPPPPMFDPTSTSPATAGLQRPVIYGQAYPKTAGPFPRVIVGVHPPPPYYANPAPPPPVGTPPHPVHQLHLGLVPPTPSRAGDSAVVAGTRRGPVPPPPVKAAEPLPPVTAAVDLPLPVKAATRKSKPQPPHMSEGPKPKPPSLVVLPTVAPLRPLTPEPPDPVPRPLTPEPPAPVPYPAVTAGAPANAPLLQPAVRVIGRRWAASRPPPVAAAINPPPTPGGNVNPHRRP